MQKFDTLNNYTNIAKKTISKLANKFYPGLSKEMLGNSDTVAEVAGAIMMADWNWDKDRVGKVSGKGKTLYSYRNQCAIWSIKTYISTKNKARKKNKQCIEKAASENTYMYDENPLDMIISNEQSNNLVVDMQSIINTSPISDKQKNHIYMYYYENKTLSEIGRIYGVTREAIRQSINKALLKIKEVINQYE
jgi:RNA polymerase sigma factor (sigma-70 family)